MAGLIRYGGIIAGQEEIDAVTEVLRGQEWASGRKAAEFEEKAAAVQGRRHALFVNSGSSALLLAMAVLPPRSRVAMPALQFPTLYSAARWCGHEPVLVDIDDSLNMDPGALIRLSAATRLDAVAAVHMAGNPANIGEISQFCDVTGYPLIEDICEAFGSRAHGVPAGNSGLASATSTHGAHHIATGEGGLVFTDDEAAYRKMRRIRDWGRAYGNASIPGYYEHYVFSELGLNLHATDIQAALGIVQLGRLDGFTGKRRASYAALEKLIAGLPLETPRTDPGCEPSWFSFPMLVRSDRERGPLMAHLAKAGIECRTIVAGNMARQPMSPGRPEDFPVADKWFRRGLWISCHPQLTSDDLDRIAEALASFWGTP